MSLINESNVDQYKTEHECDEHWELRRKFLLTHADKFPIDELICYAQVFTNVEFLGCRYPKETMRIISELSKEVVKDFREKHKNRLQRTFVGASDAASSKAKGQSKPQQSKPPQSIKTVNEGESSKQQYQQLSMNFKRQGNLMTHNKYLEDKKKKPNVNKKDEKSVVLFEYTNDTPQSIVARAASSYDIDLEYKSDVSDNLFVCSLYFNGHKVADGSGVNQKAAKKDASESALREMQKIYYTIKVTKNFTPTVHDHLKLDQESQSNSNALGNDNIGSKMMKLMGWSGGGLGKKSQGITEPVSLQQQMTREGLGLKLGLYNKQIFKKKCSAVLQNYMRGNSSSDLVFSPSFSNDERCIIHQIAKQIGLKSQSYGPKSQRTLMISRKMNPQELVNELKQLGGSTEKYQLIEPTEPK